jgi:hypothetical protein
MSRPGVPRERSGGHNGHHQHREVKPRDADARPGRDFESSYQYAADVLSSEFLVGSSSGRARQPAARWGAMRQPWLAEEVSELQKGTSRALVPDCAAEGIAVPLAVKDLGPLRGAFRRP